MFLHLGRAAVLGKLRQKPAALSINSILDGVSENVRRAVVLILTAARCCRLANDQVVLTPDLGSAVYTTQFVDGFCEINGHSLRHASLCIHISTSIFSMTKGPPSRPLSPPGNPAPSSGASWAPASATCLVSLAEFLSAYPTAGGQYQRAAIVSFNSASRAVGYVTGWPGCLVCSRAPLH